ncbi:retrovirus-related pol polyprotein from transposon TNT 1-94 [Tanacetum coccineum]
MQGTSLTKQERECKLYDAFDKFTHIKGESLHTYYLRFTKLINDMNIYKMKMEQFQVNTKFLNSLPPEWSKFITDVKLVKDLHTSNFDQLHAYLKQHELHANEVRIMHEGNQDPLAFVANQQMTPPHFNTYQSSYNNPQLQQYFAVLVFSLGDDPIACLNKAMAFVTAVASSRGDKGKIILVLLIRAMLQVQREIQQVDKQELLNATTAKVKDIWLGNTLSQSDQGILHDLGIPTDQAQTIIPHNVAFQIEDLDTYDSDCDDLSTAQAVLMANISNYGSDIITEVPNSETYLNDMDNQSVHALQDFEQTQVFKVQFDSIKQTRVRHKEQSDSLINKLNFKYVENEDLKALQDKVFVIKSLKNDLRKLKGKEIVETVVHIPSTTTTAPGMFNLDLEPLPPSELDLACKYATRIQELLVYVHDMCSNVITPSAKKVTVIPMNNIKKVRFAEPLTSSSKIQQVESSNTSDSNTQVLSSTGVKCSTSNCGLKPPGDKKNDRISQTPSRNKKNKVEAQPRKVNKVNRVVKPICDVDVKHSLSNANSEILCATCNKSMFDCVHDKCLLDLVQNGNKRVDLLSGSRDTNLHIISLDDMLKSSPVYLLSKASKTKSWLWHHRLSHLSFSTLNKLAKDGLARGIPRLKFQKDHLCSACALGKSRKSSHQPKAKDTNQEKLYLLHLDLCGMMCVASINRKRYILVIVDDYSRFIWVRFLKTKDEAPVDIIKCIKNIQVRLKATVLNVRTDNRTKFVNQTLRKWYENIGITHQTSVARTPQQNDVFERRNRTLVEAARTMLIFSKALLFLWAKAINTAFPEAAAPRAEVLGDSPMLTSIDQDAPSTSIPSSQEQEHSPIISQGFEESPKTPTFHDDLLNESP